VQNGNTFMTGNGYMGYRGTLDEARAQDFVAVNLLGIYDQHGTAWREPINAPNPFWLQVQVGAETLNTQTLKVVNHRQWLDLQTATHHRQTTFETYAGVVTLTSERFVSGADDHVLGDQVTLTVAQPTTMTVQLAIDTDIWDINGPHLFNWQREGNVMLATTGEGEQVAIGLQADFGALGMTELTDTVGQKATITVTPEKPVTLTAIAAIYTSHDVPQDTVGAAVLDEMQAVTNYETALLAHRTAWAARWDKADVQIEGDDEADLALRYSLYQLQIIAPHHLDMSIPARGLSGQTYKGAVFWDTEMFMLPFFLRNDPEVAWRLLNYRIKTLPAAKAKAAQYGYGGAFYAWESQESGQDGTSDYNITDVFTGRPMRTYFKDKQIHISAAVAYAIWNAYQLTGNNDLLINGGMEVIAECAKFYFSRAYWSPLKNRYELLDVLGPDEYHERVNNNGYTNQMAAYTVKAALAGMDLLAKIAPATAQAVIEATQWDRWRSNLQDFATKLYVPAPDSKTGLIPQFDGYFDLEDASLATVKSRLLKPNEYWGGAYGVASDTQIIKQADVVLQLRQFADQFSQNDKAKNWTYYQPRTEHGSSLSASTYALVACEIGKADWAYPFFMKTATVDLTGDSKQFAGGVYIGGTHPAANGGAWMAVTQGFCGLQEGPNGPTVASHLPQSWQSVQFKTQYRGQRYQAKVTPTSATITLVSPA